MEMSTCMLVQLKLAYNSQDPPLGQPALKLPWSASLTPQGSHAWPTL